MAPIDLNDPIAVLLAVVRAFEQAGIEAAAYGGLALALPSHYVRPNLDFTGVFTYEWAVSSYMKEVWASSGLIRTI